MFAAPAVAQADTTPYLSCSGGLLFQNNSTVNGTNDAIQYKSGYHLDAAIGLKSDAVRLEAAIGSMKAHVAPSLPAFADGRCSMMTYMANAYYDFDIAPYVMGGLSMAGITVNGRVIQGAPTSTEFAWQAGAGFGIKADDDMIIDIGYRYFSPSDGTFDGTKISLANSSLIAGIRYSF